MRIWDEAAQAAMVEDALGKCTVLIFPTVHGGWGGSGALGGEMQMSWGWAWEEES